MRESLRSPLPRRFEFLNPLKSARITVAMRDFHMDEVDTSDDHLRGITAVSRNQLKVGINIDSQEPAQCNA
jgi:hypothetical protein